MCVLQALCKVIVFPHASMSGITSGFYLVLRKGFFVD